MPILKFALKKGKQFVARKGIHDAASSIFNERVASFTSFPIFDSTPLNKGEEDDLNEDRIKYFLTKDVSELSKDEVMRIQSMKVYLDPNHPKQKELFKKVKSFYDYQEQEKFKKIFDPYIFSDNHSSKNNETLIREGNVVRRIRSDGSDGGTFQST